jgi:hypothetical protein
MRLLLRFGSVERLDLSFGQQRAIFCRLGLQRFHLLLHRLQVGRCQTQRTTAGEIDRPRRFTASATRTGPHAGCTTANSTIACSTPASVLTSGPATAL